jgi:hypothetical protein
MTGRWYVTAGIAALWTLVAAILAFIAMILCSPLLNARAADEFERDWVADFRRCHSRADAERAARGRNVLFTSFTLHDGTWVAVAARPACTDASPPDRVVIADATGRVLVSKTAHFCGYEGLMSDLHDVRALPNIRAFHAKADRLYDLHPAE